MAKGCITPYWIYRYQRSSAATEIAYSLGIQNDLVRTLVSRCSCSRIRSGHDRMGFDDVYKFIFVLWNLKIKSTNRSVQSRNKCIFQNAVFIIKYAKAFVKRHGHVDATCRDYGLKQWFPTTQLGMAKPLSYTKWNAFLSRYTRLNRTI